MKPSVKETEHGFILLEVIISMLVLAIIVVGTLMIKDTSTKLNSESGTRLKAANGVLQRERAYFLNNYGAANQVYVHTTNPAGGNFDCAADPVSTQYCSHDVVPDGFVRVTSGSGSGRAPVQVNSVNAAASSTNTPSATTVYRYTYRKNTCQHYSASAGLYYADTGDSDPDILPNDPNGAFDPLYEETCPTLVRIVVEPNGGSQTPPDGIAAQEFFYTLPKASFQS